MLGSNVSAFVWPLKFMFFQGMQSLNCDTATVWGSAVNDSMSFFIFGRPNLHQYTIKTFNVNKTMGSIFFSYLKVDLFCCPNCAITRLVAFYYLPLAPFHPHVRTTSAEQRLNTRKRMRTCPVIMPLLCHSMYLTQKQWICFYVHLHCLVVISRLHYNPAHVCVVSIPLFGCHPYVSSR